MTLQEWAQVTFVGMGTFVEAVIAWAWVVSGPPLRIRQRLSSARRAFQAAVRP